jgi:hypothetical protein
MLLLSPQRRPLPPFLCTPKGVRLQTGSCSYPAYKEVPERIQGMIWPLPRPELLVALHLLKQPGPCREKLSTEAPLVISAALSQCMTNSWPFSPWPGTPWISTPNTRD